MLSFWHHVISYSSYMTIYSINMQHFICTQNYWKGNKGLNQRLVQNILKIKAIQQHNLNSVTSNFGQATARAESRRTASLYLAPIICLQHNSIVRWNCNPKLLSQNRIPLPAPCVNIALSSRVRASFVWINIENGEQGKSLINMPEWSNTYGPDCTLGSWCFIANTQAMGKFYTLHIVHWFFFSFCFPFFPFSFLAFSFLSYGIHFS